jgi:hypothetical protein
MRVLILAAPINPDNTPHGYNWTFAFPMLLFIAIATVLYLLFSRPHRRVPNRAISLPARSGVLDSETARSASVAGGLSVAAGGGTIESHLEPHGAHAVATGVTEPADTTIDDDDPTAPEGGQPAASAGDAGQGPAMPAGATADDDDPAPAGDGENSA